MRRTARALVLVLTAALSASCGLFLDDFTKGAAPDDGGSDTDGGPGLTPCDGVDLSVSPCCDVDDHCGYSIFPFCDCPTCAWDAADCADSGAGDAGASADSGK